MYCIRGAPLSLFFTMAIAAARLTPVFADGEPPPAVPGEEIKAVALAELKMVGKNMMDLRDADGKYHIKERMEAAQKGTSGWQDFKFYNPVSKKIEPKRMYWEKHDNLVFAAGAYKPE